MYEETFLTRYRHHTLPALHGSSIEIAKANYPDLSGLMWCLTRQSSRLRREKKEQIQSVWL